MRWPYLDVLQILLLYKAFQPAMQLFDVFRAIDQRLAVIGERQGHQSAPCEPTIDAT
jgi:hypothetical protein